MVDGGDDPVELPEGGIALGAFDVLALIGEGAMARVWQGRHRSTRIPVAIKVMAAEATREATYQLAFQSELEAVARLDHPNIVSVYDYGDVPEAVTRSSGGAFEAGSPYLVMELVEGESLLTAPPVTTWLELEAVLSALLEALAHAHARGVTHRDLKPANVLLSREGRLMLTDFGLAHARSDRQQDDDRVHYASWAASGTPPFMAPEQFRGEWRDQGPWTDLYALGCLAFLLACGRPPFLHDELLAMANAHLTEPPPPIEPRFDVPYGFEGWLAALLAKRPEDRFVRAADARHALAQLSSRIQDDVVEGSSIVDEPTVEVDSERPTPRRIGYGTIPLLEPAVVRASRAARSVDAATLVERSPPPMPEDWRRHDEGLDEARLGAGLGLFGLRDPPLVGRERERERLWEALRRVVQEREPRAIVVRGSAGHGKTRLVRWIAERAHEVGAANVMRAFHTPLGGSADGVFAMASRYFRCHASTPEETKERIARSFARHAPVEPYLVESLTELLAGPIQSRDAARKAEDRLRVLLRALEVLSLARPLVIHLDDVQWGADALRLARLILLEARDETPIFVAMTVRDEAVEAGTTAGRALDRLLAIEDVGRLELTKLADADHRQLVTELLGRGDDALVNRVVERTRGNPLFAVQLIEDWIDRSLLTARDEGLMLEPRGSDTLPDDIHALCEMRIARALGGRPAADQTALELAALLGSSIDELEWRAVCKAARQTPSPTLLDALSRQGLLEPSLGTWRFSHGVVRESLERFVISEGRWRRHHRVIAATLRTLHAERSAELNERIAHHSSEGEQPHDALAPLLRAATLLRVQGEYDRAEELLDRRRSLLDQIGGRADSPQRAEGALLAVQLDLDRGRLDSAEQLARDVERRAGERGWPSLQARALLRLGDVAAVRTDYPPALERYGAALETALELGDRRAEVEARAGLAEVYYYGGDRERAQRAYEANLTAARELGDDLLAADAHWGLGYVALWWGDHDQAHDHFEQMRELLTRRGGAFRLADAYNALGEVARLRGRLVEAERCYVEALRLNEAYGTRGGLVNRMNMLFCRLGQDRPEALAPRIAALLRDAEAMEHHGVMGSLRANQLWVLAQLERWSAWDEALIRLQRLLAHWGITDGDIATGLSHAVRTVVERGQAARAQRVAELARAQWLGLSRPDEVAKIDALVSPRSG